MSKIIGLVGKPSSGKSTFFTSATLSNVEIADYPFTTINKNEAIAYITTQCPCKELNLKCNPNNSKCVNNIRYIPINIIDVAGLVPDAHTGKGRGNQFLDDLRTADALIQVIDCSGDTNEKGEPTTNYDIKNEIKFLETEINLWYHNIISKNLEKTLRKCKLEKKDTINTITEILSSFKITQTQIETALRTNNLNIEQALEWNEEQKKQFSFTLCKLSKPMIYSANKYDKQTSKKHYEILKKTYKNKTIIKTSAEYERALKNAKKNNLIDYIQNIDYSTNTTNTNKDIKKNNIEQTINYEIKIKNNNELNEKQKQALTKIQNYIKENKTTGVQECLNTVMFNILNQIVVYPVQNENKYSDKNENILPDAIILTKGSTAKDLAYKIHTDIGKSFLYAIDAKTKMRIKADQILKHNDIIKIVSTAK
jgi:ribosome-binding ATPase